MLLLLALNLFLWMKVLVYIMQIWKNSGLRKKLLNEWTGLLDFNLVENALDALGRLIAAQFMQSQLLQELEIALV